MEHRVSKEQMNFMFNTLEKHRDLLKVKVLGPRARASQDRGWDNLAQKLNAMEGGASKSGHRWKRYWIDLKHKAKTRAAQRRKPFTSSGPVNHSTLSETDQRVLSIIGLRGNLRQNVTSTTTRHAKDEETSFLEVKNDDEMDQMSGDETYISEPAFVDETYNSEHSGVDEPFISQQIDESCNIEETRVNESLEDLESRRVAVQEKWAEAAATMAQAALLQAQAHQDLITILKRKLS